MQTIKETLREIITQSISGADHLSVEDTLTVQESVDLLTECFYRAIVSKHKEEFFLSHLDLYREYFQAMAQGDESRTTELYRKIKGEFAIRQTSEHSKRGGSKS